MQRKVDQSVAAEKMSPANSGLSEGQSAPSRGFFPPPLWIAFVLMVFVGTVLLLTRSSRMENTLWDGISNCNAADYLVPQDQGKQSRTEPNGLDDLYGMVQFKSNNADITRLLSICENDPALAVKLVRRALTEGNRSAKMVALYSAYYLQNHLESQDIQKIAGLLNARNEIEVRKTAQRTLSDLTVIKNPGGAAKYEALPDKLPPSTADSEPHKIQTREETWDGNPVFTLRWSNPDLADCWWQSMAGAGTWTTGTQDMTQKRYVIP